MSRRPALTPLALLERITRRVPLPLGVRLAERLGRAYARLALSTGASLQPWRVESFPDELAALFGEAPGRSARQRLVEDRLAFVLTQWLVRRALRDGDAAPARGMLSRIDVRGEEHLTAALARGRGALAVSTHFGFPHLLRAVLDQRGIRTVGAVATVRHPDDILVYGDALTRARGLQRLRSELEQNSVCVVLPDRGLGAATRVPFFRTQLAIGLGVFHLAALTAAPIIPFFVVAPVGTRRFQLELSRALGGGGRAVVGDLIEEFTRLYASYVRQYPSHLPYRASGPLFGPVGMSFDESDR